MQTKEKSMHLTGSTATFTFPPQEYILVFSDSRGDGKEWSLNYRIDRSEKGKGDDVGLEVIFISDEDAETLKKAGFSYVEL